LTAKYTHTIDNKIALRNNRTNITPRYIAGAELIEASAGYETPDCRLVLLVLLLATAACGRTSGTGFAMPIDCRYITAPAT
jgi:hypothetical protein